MAVLTCATQTIQISGHLELVRQYWSRWMYNNEVTHDAGKKLREKRNLSWSDATKYTLTFYASACSEKSGLFA